MGEQFTVNSKQSLEYYLGHVAKLFEEHKYLTFPKPRIGRDRSLDQNALFHVWLNEMVAWKDNVNPKLVSVSKREGMKDYVKESFLTTRPSEYSWMVLEYECRKTGRKKKKYTSSRSWKTGEMFMVLEFMQNWAAKAGLILESKGEFSKKQKEQNQ